jgi:hypothetical protein
VNSELLSKSLDVVSMFTSPYSAAIRNFSTSQKSAYKPLPILSLYAKKFISVPICTSNVVSGLSPELNANEDTFTILL